MRGRPVAGRVQRARSPCLCSASSSVDASVGLKEVLLAVVRVGGARSRKSSGPWKSRPCGLVSSVEFDPGGSSFNVEVCFHETFLLVVLASTWATVPRSPQHARRTARASTKVSAETPQQLKGRRQDISDAAQAANEYTGPRRSWAAMARLACRWAARVAARAVDPQSRRTARASTEACSSTTEGSS